MKKIIAIASAGLLALALAAPVAADAGGVPNENADCHAQILASPLADALGGNPAKIAKTLGVSVKDVQAVTKACRVL